MELALQLGWFGYGIWALIIDLKWGSWFFGGASGGCPVVPNAEEDWGFGQILPMCLLFLPVFAALQSYGDDLVCDASILLSCPLLISGQRQHRLRALELTIQRKQHPSQNLTGWLDHRLDLD